MGKVKRIGVKKITNWTAHLNTSDNSQTLFKYQWEPKLVRLWVEATIKGTRRVWDVNRGQFFLLFFILLHVQLLWGFQLLFSLFLLLLLHGLTSCEFLLSLKCSNRQVVLICNWNHAANKPEGSRKFREESRMACSHSKRHKEWWRTLIRDLMLLNLKVLLGNSGSWKVLVGL